MQPRLLVAEILTALSHSINWALSTPKRNGALRNTLIEYWLAEVPSDFTQRDVAVPAAGPSLPLSVSARECMKL